MMRLSCLRGLLSKSAVIPPRLLFTRHVSEAVATEISHNQYELKMVQFFEDDKLDSWWMRKGLQELHGKDSIADMSVIIAALKACRRVNDLALAIRFLESLRIKSISDPKIWPWILQEVGPTVTELGIPTLEELGYDKAEFHYDDPGDE